MPYRRHVAGLGVERQGHGAVGVSRFADGLDISVEDKRRGGEVLVLVFIVVEEGYGLAVDAALRTISKHASELGNAYSLPSRPVHIPSS